MIRSNLIGIFGGTFDPIHFGHLRLALELYQNLNLKEVRFIPCRQPVHRNPTQASSQQRLRMLKLAIENQADFIADDRELKRTTPSYMIETLTSLRKEFSEEIHLCLILGMDALSQFTTWHRWQEILKISHIIGVTRPIEACFDGMSQLQQQNQFPSPGIPGEGLRERTSLPRQLQAILTKDIKNLVTQPTGLILLQQTTALEISATAIRQQLKQGLNPRYLLPEQVLHFIDKERLYR